MTTFDELIKKYPNGLPPGFYAIQRFGANGEVDAPVSNIPGVSLGRKVEFKQTENLKVPSYDGPDVNGTKCLFFWGNRMTESVPDRGQKMLPNEADPLKREAHLKRLFTEWAWLPKQIIYNINGKSFSFPDMSTDGKDISRFNGMWVERKAMSTPTSAEYIQLLVDALK